MMLGRFCNFWNSKQLSQNFLAKDFILIHMYYIHLLIVENINRHNSIIVKYWFEDKTNEVSLRTHFYFLSILSVLYKVQFMLFFFEFSFFFFLFYLSIFFFFSFAAIESDEWSNCSIIFLWKWEMHLKDFIFNDVLSFIHVCCVLYAVFVFLKLRIWNCFFIYAHIYINYKLLYGIAL